MTLHNTLYDAFKINDYKKLNDLIMLSKHNFVKFCALWKRYKFFNKIKSMGKIYFIYPGESSYKKFIPTKHNIHLLLALSYYINSCNKQNTIIISPCLNKQIFIANFYNISYNIYKCSYYSNDQQINILFIFNKSQQSQL